MRNIESYFDMLPYNGNLVRNSYKSGSTMIGPSEYIKPEPEGEKWFYIENPGNESISVTITNSKGEGAPFDSIEISDDKENWTELILDNDTYTFDIPATSKVYLRAEQSSWHYWKLNTTQFNVGGNIMSLLYGENFEDETTLESNYSLGGLFSDSGVVDASELILPATILTEGCYAGMFQGCTSLTAAPELPATTLAENCYSNMFEGCTSLTSAPELPSTTLTGSCYASMFSGCTSLTEASTLPATTLAGGCYYYMFSGCTSLTSAPELPATTLADSCYNSMFSGCTSLTATPELPAQNLALYCYQAMFYGCSSLDLVIVHVTGTWDSNCTDSWLGNVAPTGTLYNLGGAIDIPLNSKSGCPSGWTIETTPPTPKGTGWTPSDPIDITGTELEDLLAGEGGKKSVSGANQGYFYNVTEASIKYSVGLYVAVTPSDVQSFDINNSMTEEEFKALVDKGSLISKTVYYITDSEKVRVASSSSTYKEIEREEPSPKTGYVIKDVTEEYVPEYQWKVTFEVTVDNNEVLSFDTKESLSKYYKMQYTLADLNKNVICSNTFKGVPVSVYTMTDLKDGEYILMLGGEYLDGDKDIPVYRYFSITKSTEPGPSEDYTVTDDTPSDKRWDNSFDVYVDPNFKEGNMTLLIGANKNTTSFEGYASYSLTNEKQVIVSSDKFSYEKLNDPIPVYSMDTLENGTYYLTLTDPKAEGYRSYTIIKNVKL